jgi:hypothetical protein
MLEAGRNTHRQVIVAVANRHKHGAQCGNSWDMDAKRNSFEICNFVGINHPGSDVSLKATLHMETSYV